MGHLMVASQLSKSRIVVHTPAAMKAVSRAGRRSTTGGCSTMDINTLLPGVRLGTIFKGVWPFVVVQVLMLIVLVAFPILSLWLPSFMQ